jgi:sugar lactone lactonase YvrE
MDAEVFRSSRAILVESIFWDARTDELAWVDITAGTFHRGRLDGAPDGSDDRVVALPAPVSAVQPAVDGGYVAALKDRVVALDADGAITRELASFAHAHAGIRCNEGKVDPFGTFVVGSMNVTTGEPDGALYAVDARGDARLLRGGFGVANGFEWSDDGRTMYVTDTATTTVYRATYGDGARLGELTPFLTGYASDGLARDREGGFWNGVYGEGRVLHWSAGGEVVGEIAVPAPNVTSVAFGGPSSDILFIGSARENLDEETLAASPLSGAIFRANPGTSGRGPGVFGAPAAS